MTVFFPTILLNVIGFATNFFKTFFFEARITNIEFLNVCIPLQAVITVNLTCMLVLTTMFINVSNNLPTTSYMKMIDVWLLFNLILPFIVVLVHTYMDTLRNDEEREINHHGKSVSVGQESPEETTKSVIKVQNF